MMENRPPLTSPDGSRNRNTPERCPRPLYSRDSTQEHQEIPQARPLYSGDSTQEHNQILCSYQYKKYIKTEIKEEAEERFVRGDKPCKEEEIPPEIGTDTRAAQRDVKAEEEKEGGMKIKEEKLPPENSSGEESSSTDSEDAIANRRDIKAEEEEKQVKNKKKILEIGMDGRYRWYNIEKHPIRSPEGEIVEDDITAYLAEEKAITPNLRPGSYKAEKPFSCPDCGKRFTHESYLIIHHRSHTGEKPFVCPECGKRFTYKCSLAQHLAAHSAVWAFPCPECGKRFRTGWILAAHRRLHSSEDIQR